MPDSWPALRVHAVFLLLLSALGAAQTQPRALPEYWFDEDEWHLQVKYLLTAEELSAYRELKTADTREDFITTFWLRRDPTVGTSANEFRDEFNRRVEYANVHFAHPNSSARSGIETDRGRIYVLFGAPNNVAAFETGAYEIWRYEDSSGAGNALRIQFSVPPISSCDGSYRILSPTPLASFREANTSVHVYPRLFTTASIRIDFSRAVSVGWMLRNRAGEPVLDNDVPVLEGELGQARNNEPLSQHLLGCRMFETGGMGFTHILPVGSYIFSTVVTFTTGDVQREAVAFTVN
jgi:GWxTD domain-containing protein